MTAAAAGGAGARGVAGTPGTGPRIVCLSGSLATGSRTEHIVRWCAAEAGRLGASATLLTGPELEFPLFRPSQPRPAEVRRYLALLTGADGVVLGSPTYHGTLSGLLKNALDYVQDLESAAPPFLDGRPVGCVAVSSGEQGAAATLATLRTVAHALRGWPTPLGVVVSSGRDLDADGVPRGDKLVTQLRLMLGQVLPMAALNQRRRRRAAERSAARP